MFGPISPRVKDLTQHQNIFTKDQYLANRTEAVSGGNRSSPALILEGRGYNTTTGKSTHLAYRSQIISSQGTTPYAQWRLDYSSNNSAFTNVLNYNPIGLASVKPLFSFTGYGKFQTDNASTVDTLLSFDIASSGSTNHLGLSLSGTTRAAFSTNSSGTLEYRAAGSSSLHSFYYGSSIGSQFLIAQLYSGGLYTGLNAYVGGKVTAGQTDQSVQTTLSTYGSFAAKGKYVNSASYVLDHTETFVYIDPTYGEFCTGTPTACNTYMTEGNCNAHTGVGCTWYAGDSCGAFTGTDESTCESGHAGCTWEETSCNSASNTDQSTCENQDDSYGGNCSWDTGLCPSLGASQGVCEAQNGCTWNSSPCTAFNGQSQGTCEGNTGCTWVGGDCSAFNNTDQSTCETGHTGCIWDGVDTCNGTYDEASVCNGEYDTSCSGDICTGNFNTGNCNGTYGATCNGTAQCSNLTDDGSVACAAESGCAWQIGITVTLPTHANANRSGTGRMYSIVHVGDRGTAQINGQSGEPIFQYTNIKLFKKGDKVILHNQSIAFPCSQIPTQTPCNAQTGCSWLPTCSTIGDQPTCDSTSGCAWDGENNICTGPSARCSGTYSNGSYWYAHSLERGQNYVLKTASYTLTDIDDLVVFNSASPLTATLPDAITNANKVYTIKNLGAGTLTLATTSSQTIDGFASGVLTLAQYESVLIGSNAANWIRQAIL